jgi:hypothetical protein
MLIILIRIDEKLQQKYLVCTSQSKKDDPSFAMQFHSGHSETSTHQHTMKDG